MNKLLPQFKFLLDLLRMENGGGGGGGGGGGQEQKAPLITNFSCNFSKRGS